MSFYKCGNCNVSLIDPEFYYRLNGGNDTGYCKKSELIYSLNVEE